MRDVSTNLGSTAKGGTIQRIALESFDEGSLPSRESDIYLLGMVIYQVCCTIFLGELAH